MEKREMLTTRVTIKTLHPKYKFIQSITDFGIDYTPHDKAVKHPRVLEKIKELTDKGVSMDNIQVDFRDVI